MTDELTTDWVNLPPETQSISIWDSVHDGELRAIKSDLLARTVEIEFAVPYLASFHNLPDKLTFKFMLEGVQSVRVLCYSVWPGEFAIPSGLSWDEQQRLAAENRSMWRQESESWGTFEREAASDEDAELTDGDIVRSPSGNFALRFGVQMSTGQWYEVFFRAQGLTIRSSDEQELELEAFLKLGNAYWEAFANKERKHSSENG